MYQPQGWRLGGTRREPSRRRSLLPLLMLLGGLTFLYAGGDLLYRHFASDAARPHRALAGWALVAVALVQCRLAHVAWRREAKHPGCTTTSSAVQPGCYTHRFGLRSSYWRWFLLGPVVCYLAMLMLGPDRHGRYLFRAAIGLWYTLMLVPVVMPEVLAGRWCAWARWRPLRQVARAAFLLLLVGVSGELGLRLYGSLSGDPLDATVLAQQCLLSPGSDLGGRRVNRLGYWDDEFQIERRPGVMRVAVIGDEVTLSGSHESNFLTRVERSLPGVEIYNFGLPHSGPREYTAILTSQVLAFQPDLVLTCISVADDVTGRLPTPSQFDWQRLYVVQFARRAFGRETLQQSCAALMESRTSKIEDRTSNIQLASASFDVGCSMFDVGCSAHCHPAPEETYLQVTAAQLAVCRSPLDDRMRRRWQETFAHLNELAAICRRNHIATALVVAPSVLQLDARLRDTLCRRAGYRAGEVDVQLPQRQLSQFAQEHGLPLIDLLPHFRLPDQPTFASSGCQWNDLGNQVAADALAAWLRQRGATLVARK